MREGPDISRLAALIGDPARANILTALMGGHALTASELAAEAGIALPTASQHLSKLTGAGFLEVRKSGRHKYFTIAGPEVAQVLEGLMGLAERHGLTRVRPGPKDARMRKARVCYNHLAGTMGVQLYDSLTARRLLDVGGDGLTLSDAGRAFAEDFGIDLAPLEKSRAPMCRECLDWSERRNHLAGSLGRAFFARMEGLGWLRREPDSRAVLFSAPGAKDFAARFPGGSAEATGAG